MRVMRLVGFGSICVSAGLGAWACQDDPTGATASSDGGPLTPFDSGGSSAPDTGSTPTDAAPPEAAWCGHADGGVQSRCDTHQWDDLVPDAAAPNCKACPGRALTCADLVRRGDDGTTLISPTYDHYGTKTLSVDVTPHAAEIVGGVVTVTHSVCYAAQASDASTSTVQLQVEGNQLRAPLEATLDGGTYDAPCGEITYQLVDSCCTQSTVKFETYFDPESSLYKTSCPDGG